MELLRAFGYGTGQAELEKMPEQIRRDRAARAAFIHDPAVSQMSHGQNFCDKGTNSYLYV